MAHSKEDFLKLLQELASQFKKVLASKDGEWVVKGFIDIFRNVYTISDDTKVISKIIEIMLFPAVAEFARKYDLKLVPASEQNHYPDITFIDKTDRKFAVDFKTTYRADAETVNSMTLGAFTGYFRDRKSTKNTTFAYGDYVGHYVLGVIYSRQESRVDQTKKYAVDQLKSIPSVIKDFGFFAQLKYRIAKDQPGSGNTKNIGSITRIADLIDGNGPFASRGEDVFDDYWMYYLTSDMAKKVDLVKPPYRNLESYDEYKNAVVQKASAVRKKLKPDVSSRQVSRSSKKDSKK